MHPATPHCQNPGRNRANRWTFEPMADDQTGREELRIQAPALGNLFFAVLPKPVVHCTSVYRNGMFFIRLATGSVPAALWTPPTCFSLITRIGDRRREYS